MDLCLVTPIYHTRASSQYIPIKRDSQLLFEKKSNLTEKLKFVFKELMDYLVKTGKINYVVNNNKIKIYAHMNNLQKMTSVIL